MWLRTVPYRVSSTVPPLPHFHRYLFFWARTESVSRTEYLQWEGICFHEAGAKEGHLGFGSKAGLG